jgi:hypothetical protein
MATISEPSIPEKSIIIVSFALPPELICYSYQLPYSNDSVK